MFAERAEFLIPDGYDSGLPLVRVSARSLEVNGMPKVDFLLLKEMVADFKVPDNITPEIDIVHNPEGWFLGLCEPFSTKIVVNEALIPRSLDFRGQLLKILLHETQHLSDYSRNRTYPVVLSSILMSGFFNVCASMVRRPYSKIAHKISPMERRAYRAEKDSSFLTKYAGVIVY